MMRTPGVSVIVPSFHRPDYTAQAVESILAQSLPAAEILVVDDGSGEDTVCRYDFRPPVRLLRHEQRRGPSAARNTGIRAATGNYIAFLDSDDTWEPGKLQAQVRLLEAHPEAGLTYCQALSVDESLAPLDRQDDPVLVTGERFDLLLRRWFIRSPSTVLVRRSVLEQAGGFDETLGFAEDWDLWLRLALVARFVPDPERRVRYRCHPEQLTRTSVTKDRGDLAFLAKWRMWAQRERPDLLPVLRKAECRVLNHVAKDMAHGERDLVGAVHSLCRAILTCPTDLRSYGLLLRTVASPLRPSSGALPEAPRQD